MEESISLEETNKIRISLGLKPLTDDSAPVDDKEKQAEQNYASQREQEAKAKEEKSFFVISHALTSFLTILCVFPGESGIASRSEWFPFAMCPSVASTLLGLSGDLRS